MIEYGSDYLLGLASFAPEKFAERDRLWEAAIRPTMRFRRAAVSGNVAFRPLFRRTSIRLRCFCI